MNFGVNVDNMRAICKAATVLIYRSMNMIDWQQPFKNIFPCNENNLVLRDFVKILTLRQAFRIQQAHMIACSLRNGATAFILYFDIKLGAISFFS